MTVLQKDNIQNEIDQIKKEIDLLQTRKTKKVRLNSEMG